VCGSSDSGPGDGKRYDTAGILFYYLYYSIAIVLSVIIPMRNMLQKEQQFLPGE
jgi:hypothetical protein